MNDPMLPLPGLSPVSGKRVEVKFDGGLLSSDGGVLALREVDQRLRVADRLAACMVDRRAPDQITRSLADIIRFRLLMIAAGYEDGNDANCLRSDPMFKMALDLTPSDRELCSQSTISRLENLPEARALLRMGRAMVDLYCASFHKVPKRITLDIDDTFDAVHGGQQLRLFNAHYDEYGFQPIVVFDGEGRFVTAVLRPAKRPSGKEIKPFLRRLLRAIRAHWPNTEILVRADSHYCGPEVLDWCRASGLDYILGVAPTTTLRRHVESLEASVKARFEAAPRDGKLRRPCELQYNVGLLNAGAAVGAAWHGGRSFPPKSNRRAMISDAPCTTHAATQRRLVCVPWDNRQILEMPRSDGECAPLGSWQAPSYRRSTRISRYISLGNCLAGVKSIESLTPMQGRIEGQHKLATATPHFGRTLQFRPMSEDLCCWSSRRITSRHGRFGANAKRSAVAATIWSFVAPPTHSKRQRQRRCLKRRSCPHNEEIVQPTPTNLNSSRRFNVFLTGLSRTYLQS